MQKNLTTCIIPALLLALVSMNSFAQTITTPRTPSPAAMVSQTIGISTVKVKYSRPSIRNRAVWGELVPYGWSVQPGGTTSLAPWRAGANENTVIEFSHPAKVEGQSVPAGSYGLFFVINKDDSGEVILSKDYKSWGNFFYTPDHDQLRAKIQLRSTSDLPAKPRRPEALRSQGPTTFFISRNTDVAKRAQSNIKPRAQQFFRAA